MVRCECVKGQGEGRGTRGGRESEEVEEKGEGGVTQEEEGVGGS